MGQKDLQDGKSGRSIPIPSMKKLIKVFYLDTKGGIF